jgi:hypothetical protein
VFLPHPGGVKRVALSAVNGKWRLSIAAARPARHRDVPVWDLSAHGCSAQATLDLNLI